jgi:hypothetical protein
MARQGPFLIGEEGMHHFVREHAGSVVDTAIEIHVCSQEPDPSDTGVTEVSATIADQGGESGIEHCWLRAPGETERDFVAMALAAAGELGIKAVVFTGIAVVPAALEERDA